MDELYDLLDGLHLNIDFRREEHLIDDGLLQSLDIVMLVGELMAHYGVEITVDDLLPEHFNSAQAMYALIQRLLDEE